MAKNHYIPMKIGEIAHLKRFMAHSEEGIDTDNRIVH